MAQQIISTNTFTTAKWIVSATASDGTHTTIAAALTAASSGDTIFIRPGTYTENLTLKAGVNLTAYGSDDSLNNTARVNITGKATFTAAGSVTISGIELQTNSDFFLAVTNSAASIVNLDNCYLNSSNNTGISFTSSSSSAIINISYCWGDIGTTGIGLFASTSAGTMNIYFSNIRNSGATTTASTISAGQININNSLIYFPITTSSTATLTSSRCFYNVTNTTIFTIGGSGPAGFLHCDFDSGTASAVSVSSTVSFSLCVINSSNTNAITGAGSAVLSGTTFIGTSIKSNVTTQTGGVLTGLTQGSAPSAGYIGEQLTANATAVATTSTTAKTITSISLTPGVWDITGSAYGTATGGTAVMSTLAAGINTVTNTLPATAGVDYSVINLGVGTAANLGIVVPTVRATLSATTTYYLVVTTIYTSTTCPCNAKITATRVG